MNSITNTNIKYWLEAKLSERKTHLWRTHGKIEISMSHKNQAGLKSNGAGFSGTLAKPATPLTVSTGISAVAGNSYCQPRYPGNHTEVEATATVRVTVNVPVQGTITGYVVIVTVS